MGNGTINSLAQRSVTSLKWNAGGSLLQLALSFISVIVLARLLPVETFGIYATAISVVELSRTFANFGMGGAFLYRTEATADIEQTANLHFTLKLLFVFLWALFLLTGIFLFTVPKQAELRTAFLVVTACEVVLELLQTPRLILTREVKHRRLAIVQLIDSGLTTVITMVLALGGAGLWALLASNIISMIVNIIGFYLWRPFWRPHLFWSTSGARYFISFGGRNLLALFLLSALDRIDDIWTGAFLGTEPLGFYSRAYRFAKLPSGILANPINTVAAGTYAELKDDRHKLSLTFNRINGLMIRSGFLIAGILALAAPELIRMFLGEKWLPMLDAFRLMLVFTLFDPLKQTIAHLFISGLGNPGTVVQVRSIQMVVLLVGLFGFGLPLGIAGVALAVDIMLVLGILLMLWRARNYVDFSIMRLFSMPVLAILLALLAGSMAGSWSVLNDRDWLSAVVKTLVFSGVFISILICLDRPQLADMNYVIRRYLIRGVKATPDQATSNDTSD